MEESINATYIPLSLAFLQLSTSSSEFAGAADSKKLKKAVETAGYKVISIK